MYKAKMIKVDLSKELTSVEPLREDLTRDFLGGEGIGTRLLWEIVDAHTGPLTPENALLFSSAPLNGTIFPAGARGCVVFKSPERCATHTAMCRKEPVESGGLASYYLMR